MSNDQVEVYIAAPHQFFKEHQQDLLPDWNVEVVSVILFLQRSRISLRESTTEVVREKDRLRANFIRFGCKTMFDLQDLGYKSDLFDPRNGRSLLSCQGNLTLDDSAVVSALLHYPVSSYKNCSLIEHPNWGHNIYPGTIVTQAEHRVAELLVKQNQTTIGKATTV